MHIPFNVAKRIRTMISHRNTKDTLLFKLNDALITLKFPIPLNGVGFQRALKVVIHELKHPELRRDLHSIVQTYFFNTQHP